MSILHCVQSLLRKNIKISHMNVMCALGPWLNQLDTILYVHVQYTIQKVVTKQWRMALFILYTLPSTTYQLQLHLLQTDRQTYLFVFLFLFFQFVGKYNIIYGQLYNCNTIKWIDMYQCYYMSKLSSNVHRQWIE